MLDNVRAVTRGTLDILELVAVFCGLTLFVLAALSLLLATLRVTVRGRVLVLPFGGTEPRRVELTDLFVRRLTELEQEWIDLAREVRTTRNDINTRVEAHPYRRALGAAPLTSGERLPPLRDAVRTVFAVTAPRTSGDELLENIVQLERAGSIMNADLGVISVAGVSFSPRDVLALLRAAPGSFARRTLRGAIIAVPGGSLVSVEFQERGIRGSRRRAQLAEVRDDSWLPSLDDLAYRLAKDRVYLVRDRAGDRATAHAATDGDPLDTQSKTVGGAVIEAATWSACRAFLTGYAAHLRHYRYGRAADREQAVAWYDRALAEQPGFSRASYNRAALLYNRYHPESNDEAIEGFAAATGSNDRMLSALAFAGLAMAHCQAVQRFHRDLGDHERPAREAAEHARERAPQLEEAVFVGGWVHQINERWIEAIRAYDAVLALDGTSAAARRIKSFALNNAAWITLTKLERDPEYLRRAEERLWEALELYPNKVAYANLAEIARRSDRGTEAIDLYEIALSLDPAYIDALNERAIVEAELAAAARRDGRSADERRYEAAADADADAAQQLAGNDPGYAARLIEAFATARAAARERDEPHVTPEGNG
jgi:tetratricopeptide (TPR) repeat protein